MSQLESFVLVLRYIFVTGKHSLKIEQINDIKYSNINEFLENSRIIFKEIWLPCIAGR